jgi:acetyl-CoA carboxylase alpha subunit
MEPPTTSTWPEGSSGVVQLRSHREAQNCQTGSTRAPRFKSPEQVARARRVMETANHLRMPIIVHARSSGTYGREEAGIFLHQQRRPHLRDP